MVGSIDKLEYDDRENKSVCIKVKFTGVDNLTVAVHKNILLRKCTLKYTLLLRKEV